MQAVRTTYATTIGNEAGARTTAINNLKALITVESNTDRAAADTGVRNAMTALTSTVQSNLDGLSKGLVDRISTAQSVITWTSTLLLAQVPAINARSPIKRNIWSGWCGTHPGSK